MLPKTLPKPIVNFIEAMNLHDSAGMVAAFADSALVIDQQREHHGKDAIRGWADKEIVGDMVTMNVTDTADRHGGQIVTAHVTGTYDKNGLPDPLILCFDFSLGQDGITAMTVVPATPVVA